MALKQAPLDLTWGYNCVYSGPRSPPRSLRHLIVHNEWKIRRHWPAQKFSRGQGAPHETYVELSILLSYPCNDVLNTPSVTLLPSVSSTWYLSGLHHGCILLLKSLPYSLRTFQVLVYTLHDTTFFFRVERFCCKIVYAVIKAPLDHVGIHLKQPTVSQWL